jgi:hypothetical protein
MEAKTIRIPNTLRLKFIFKTSLALQESIFPFAGTLVDRRRTLRYQMAFLAWRFLHHLDWNTRLNRVFDAPGRFC